ncbi:MAG: ABC transporter permease [Actinomycetia bacterium]|nr:ABC transporter permease [Actinomycetes bacterium]
MIRRVVGVALQGVRARPGRSALTMVSLFVGVLAVVIIQAGFGAVKDAYSSQAILSTGRPTTLMAIIGGGMQSYERSDAACSALQRILAPVGGGSAVVVETELVFGARGLETLLVDGDLRAVFPYPLRAGHWLSDHSTAPPEVVLNEAAAQALDVVPGSSVVASVREGGRSRSLVAHVAGIVYDSQPVGRAFMRLDPMADWGLALLGQDGATLYAYAPELDESALRSVLAVEYERAFEVPATGIQRSDKPDDAGQFFSTVSLVFSAVAALSLLVGALGILNIGLATLKERSDELSLRRSFGATRWEVMVTIVAEGQMLAVVAAAAALASSYLVFPVVLDWMSRGLLVSRAGSPISAVLVGVGASCAAAFVGSLAPALRAGRVPIASIMRV